MNRTLLLIRHGKSSWDNEHLSDLERPLTSRGVRNSTDMAHWVTREQLVPDMLFSSPATRALTTARIMFQTWNLPPDKLQVHEELYMAGEKEIREVLGRASDDLATVALFGHNPTFTDFANRFLLDPLDNLPTTGLVAVHLTLESWSALDKGRVQDTRVMFPRLLEGGTPWSK
ncbi:MAG: histidine phosphatase family protein [Bacteroidales bacterium]